MVHSGSQPLLIWSELLEFGGKQRWFDSSIAAIEEEKM
jgi:hypothetical protein